MSLTPKQMAFVKAYVVDSNGKKAAIKAGYSPASAAVEANRQLKKANVAAEIKRRRALADSAVKAVEIQQTAFVPNLIAAFEIKDAEFFLLKTMNDPEVEMKLKVESAKALLPYQKAKIGETGKKQQQKETASKAASRFGVRPQPPALVALVAAGGKKV